LIDRASASAGVVSAAVASPLPLGGESYGATVLADDGSTRGDALYASVSPRYFETMHLAIVRGREFTQADTAQAAPVVIVNETLARALWSGADPIGRRVRIGDRAAPSREVIGVARDAKYLFLTESPIGAYYLPLQPLDGRVTSLLVRTRDDPRATLASLTDIARGLDPDLPLFHAQTVDQRIRETVKLRRAAASLVGVLGGLTLLLAAVGIYAVAAHSASVRTREVGIRMSLGARAVDVCRMFVLESLSLTLAGVVIGLGLSAAVSHLLTAFLFGLTPTDAATLAGATMMVCAVSMVASYIPARRAAHLDPLLALRHE
jgi:putative ABC transport system permease protein